MVELGCANLEGRLQQARDIINNDKDIGNFVKRLSSFNRLEGTNYNIEIMAQSAIVDYMVANGLPSRLLRASLEYQEMRVYVKSKLFDIYDEARLRAFPDECKY